MKYLAVLLCVFVFSTISHVFGQKISETNFSLGINKTSSSVQQEYWGDDPAPTYLTLITTKSYYNNDYKFSLRKEIGFNLQYANLNLSNNGGLGASSHYTGNIISLFAEACVQARFRIDSTYAIGIGPVAEYLITGNNNLNITYSTMLTDPPSSGNISKTGFNRDYFNKPTFGIKLSLFEARISERTNFGLNVSYLWTKSESSNFYASNYFRASLLIGFKQKEKTAHKNLK